MRNPDAQQPFGLGRADKCAKMMVLAHTEPLSVQLTFPARGLSAFS
jgi:hypothetical protein